MSKVPGRSFCSACNKQSHGTACKRGKCQCNCRWMTEEQIKSIMTGRNEEEFTYSEESNQQFEQIMENWKKK